MVQPQMARSQVERDVPVCHVTVVHQDLVNRLKPEVERVQGVADLFKAVADDTRAKVVYALSMAELCVCDVAALIDGTKATASYHLRLLHQMGLAKYRKDGRMVYYRLSNPYLGQLVQQVLRHSQET